MQRRASFDCQCCKLKTPWREVSTDLPAEFSTPKLVALPFSKSPAHLLSNGVIEDRSAKRAGIALA